MGYACIGVRIHSFIQGAFPSFVLEYALLQFSRILYEISVCSKHVMKYTRISDWWLCNESGLTVKATTMTTKISKARDSGDRLHRQTSLWPWRMQQCAMPVYLLLDHAPHDQRCSPPSNPLLSLVPRPPSPFPTRWWGRRLVAACYFAARLWILVRFDGETEAGASCRRRQSAGPASAPAVGHCDRHAHLECSRKLVIFLNIL
jgi:hypothetical protein